MLWLFHVGTLYCCKGELNRKKSQVNSPPQAKYKYTRHTQIVLGWFTKLHSLSCLLGGIHKNDLYASVHCCNVTNQGECKHLRIDEILAQCYADT